MPTSVALKPKFEQGTHAGIVSKQFHLFPQINLNKMFEPIISTNRMEHYMLACILSHPLLSLLQTKILSSIVKHSKLYHSRFNRNQISPRSTAAGQFYWSTNTQAEKNNLSHLSFLNCSVPYGDHARMHRTKIAIILWIFSMIFLCTSRPLRTLGDLKI